MDINPNVYYPIRYLSREVRKLSGTEVEIIDHVDNGVNVIHTKPYVRTFDKEYLKKFFKGKKYRKTEYGVLKECQDDDEKEKSESAS